MGSSTKYILINIGKIILVLFLLVVVFTVGTMIGYGVLGDGNMSDVFDVEVWAHITDFFK